MGHPGDKHAVSYMLCHRMSSVLFLATNKLLEIDLQGGPTKVKPTHIFCW